MFELTRRRGIAATGSLVVSFALLAGACGSKKSSGIDFKGLGSGPVVYSALTKDQIQIAAVFTSDGAIAANHLVLLNDDKGLQPAQNLVPVGGAKVLTGDVASVVNNAFAKLTTADLSAMNASVDIDKKDPDDVAKAWLSSNGLLTATPALSGKITVGSANFTEQLIVGNLLGDLLAAHGMSVTKKLNIGAREVVAPALQKGDIDAYVEYLGAYLTYLKGGDPTANVQDTLALLKTATSKIGLVALDASPADDKDGLAVTQKTADKYKLKNISDLVNVKDKLTMGGPPECPTRPYCIMGYEKTYGLKFNV
jgi:osmoprotectant transport system substrate-binding protein